MIIEPEESEHYLFVLLVVVPMMIYLIVDGLRERKKLQREEALENPCPEKEKIPFFKDEATQKKVLCLFCEMSEKEIYDNKKSLKCFLLKTYALNLQSYSEGIELIYSEIESPHKRKMIKQILDEVIYEKSVIPFAAKRGICKLKSFPMNEITYTIHFKNSEDIPEILHPN